MKPLLPAFARFLGYGVVALGLFLPFLLYMFGMVNDHNLLLYKECSKLLMMFGALMILFAAPTAVSSYPMAVAMDADGEFAAQMVAYTTIFCLPTIFLWTLLLNTMGWM